MRTCLALLVTCLVAASASAYAESTEYAVRWDPGKSAPRTASEAAIKFGVHDDKPKAFQVKYLDVRQPGDLPGPEVHVIARERTDDDGPEAMYKVRGPNAGDTPAVLAKWKCPLKGKQETKKEVDVSWVTDETTRATPPVKREAYSFSCSVEGAASGAFPQALAMSPRPCVNKVSRLKQEDKAKQTAWKIEEWQLPAGGRIIELSYSVPIGSPEHEAAFQAKVDVLVKGGAILLPASKTTLGSTCT